MKQLIFMLFITATLFTSCKKEKTKEELLTRKWTITNAKLNGANLDNAKNSTYLFKENKRFEIFYDWLNQTDTGDWSLKNNDSEIEFYFDANSSSEVWKINELSEDLLKIETEDFDNNGNFYRWEFVLE